MINIVVVGTGMYTIGRHTDGFGTIVPALNEWAKKQQDEVTIHLVGSKGKNNDSIREKINGFKALSGSQLQFSLWPEDGVVDDEAYKRALNEIDQPFCCVVAVPDNLHYDVASESVSKQIPTLVVKPLTPTYKDSLDLVSLCKKHNTYGCVEFHKRFDAANLMFRDHFRKGGLGTPLYSVVEYSQRVVIPSKVFRGWVETTNIFQYLGVHYVDIMRFVTGATPTRVSAIGQKTLLKKQGIDTYDSIQCNIEWRLPNATESFIQTLLVNWIDPETSPAMSNQRIKMIGTNGRFESDQTDRGISIYTNENNFSTPNPYFCTTYGIEEGKVEWKGYGIDSITTFADDCYRLRKGEITMSDLEQLRPTFEESLISSLVVEACNLSLPQNGAWVDIEELRV
ncbi:gfo/Idh/MocA family oxidoreductase [Marinomonas sp. CT5]|uniref:Gfo/Idh/MocA family protein n=1 Tax=Marinomonas sp. CT5 TaxID=2066133 RepID=UPI001BAEE894|nr:Gfo/Idh/MocA family oxidoreductase [Marinomonas sp. CT5]QUX94555.1 gfo/Idh/MocA family oxidoreductase [Marinomonas sp. CT5]